MMQIEVTEKSLHLAVVKAAGKLSVSSRDLNYQVIEEKTGFLGIFGKKITIKAWKGKKQAASTKVNGQKRKKQTKNIATKKLDVKLEKKILDYFQKLCEKTLGETVKVKSYQDGENLVLDAKSDFLKEKAQGGSKLAESFEHILRKYPRSLGKELSCRIFVDFNGVRKAKEKDLILTAKKMSKRVFDKKRPVVLNYKNPYERKIIHMALDEDQRVYTKSIGVGSNRKLMILPTKS